MTQTHTGRHRTAGRYNPLAEFSTVVVESAAPVARTSALLAVTGGLVGAAAAPAMASPAEVVAAPAAPAVQAAPAVTAPAAVSAPKATTASVTSFGAIKVRAVARPKGPTPQQLAARAQREARRAAAERAAQQRAEAAARAAEQAAAQRADQAASRTQARTAPAAQSTPAPQPAPAPAPQSAPTAAPAPTGGVLGIAAGLSGIPYVYGGSTPAGFDCSGFTQYIFAKVGKSLPRTAEAQRQAATPVSNPQPGDLVFFGAPAYHVGIYAGNGMMYDSPRTGLSSGKRAMWSRTGVSYGRF